jgi:hypothetical protein
MTDALDARALEATTKTVNKAHVMQYDTRSFTTTEPQ